MRQLISEVDTNAVREKFTKIDKEPIYNKWLLKAREYKLFFKEPQGGEENNDIVSTDEISNFTKDYLNRIIYNLSYVFFFLH